MGSFGRKRRCSGVLPFEAASCDGGQAELSAMGSTGGTFARAVSPPMVAIPLSRLCMMAGCSMQMKCLSGMEIQGDGGMWCGGAVIASVRSSRVRLQMRVFVLVK